MPVTATAKRALRSSARKALINKNIISELEAAIRQAKRSKTVIAIKKAMSLADRAAKKNTIHKNKAARIKSTLSKLAKPTGKPKTVKKTSPKKKASKK